MPKLAIKYQRRLDRLRKLLLADARNKKGVQFNIDVVAKTTAATSEEIVSCGTQACAMGLAAISGAFKREGLDYIWRSFPWQSEFQHLDIKMNGRRADYDRAAIHLFGVDRKTAGWLFDPQSYQQHPSRGRFAAGERAVARRVRHIANGGAYDDRKAARL